MLIDQVSYEKLKNMQDLKSLLDQHVIRSLGRYTNYDWKAIAVTFPDKASYADTLTIIIEKPELQKYLPSAVKELTLLYHLEVGLPPHPLNVLWAWAVFNISADAGDTIDYVISTLDKSADPAVKQFISKSCQELAQNSNQFLAEYGSKIITK